MHRFFVKPESIYGDRVRLQGEVAHRIRRVLRMLPGEEVMLLDGLGSQYCVRLDLLEKEGISGTVLRMVEGSNEARMRVTLCQGILKSEKFDWVLQKGTELGIAEFIPTICTRSIPKIATSDDSPRMTRWRKVVTEAAEQSGRNLRPIVRTPIGFENACDLIDSSNLALIPWEGARGPGIRAALLGRPVDRVCLFVGPEGGFTFEEIQYAKALNIVPVSLGKLVLRAETAGLVAATAVLYEGGDLGG